MRISAQFQTDRLILRCWLNSDREPFAQMNADPRVMQYYPSFLTSEQSDALVDRIKAHFARHNFGLWAAELRATGEFIGYIGLSVPTFTAHFTSPEHPATEIGWRLAAEHWGQGLATEGARPILVHAFTVLKLDEVVSFTTTANIASRRVMEKLGMTHNPADDFDHPNLPEGHPLRHHVLYRFARPTSPATDN